LSGRCEDKNANAAASLKVGQKIAGREQRSIGRRHVRCYMDRMQVFLPYLVQIAVGAVAVVLLLGLYNMMRGGSPNTSQKLMRLRVLLQFIAIVVIMATIYFLHG